MSNPYLIPNFHSLTEINASLNSIHHCFGFSSQLDFNGSGIYGEIQLKINKTANYYALKPTLPYFCDNTTDVYNYAAKNCLIYCQNKHLLISNLRNKIIGLNIESNKVTDIEKSGGNSIDVTQNHFYSYDESVSYGPFEYCTQNIYNLFNCEEYSKPILELKLNSYGNKSEITANSRNSIRIFRFNDEMNDENEVNLELFNEINETNISLPSESMFDNSDRNPFSENEILISYTSGNIINNYDIETNETIWKSNEKFVNKSNKQIGLYWSQWNNRMFFYGEHERILFVDTRGHKEVVEIYKKGGNNLFDWELFYAISPNKLNNSQLFVASDYHIFLTDLRFPKENLIQLNHMLPKTIVRNMKSLVIENVDDSKTELLVSSNFHRNCLMSFSSNGTAIQPISLHLPLHLSTPKDIDKKFENYFLRGLELIEHENRLGFSIALLTNSGHIFMQDLYHETGDNECNSDEVRDKCFTGGIGSSSLELDHKSVEYMTCINGFIDRLLLKKEIEMIESNKCLNCSQNIKCTFDENVCHCRNLRDFDDVSDDEDSDQHSVQDYDQYIGNDIIKLRAKLNNSEELNEKSNDYTKQIYSLWDDIYSTSSQT